MSLPFKTGLKGAVSVTMTARAQCWPFRRSLSSPVNLLQARVGSSLRPHLRRGVGLGQAPGRLRALACITPSPPPPDLLGFTVLRATGTGGARTRHPVTDAFIFSQTPLRSLLTLASCNKYLSGQWHTRQSMTSFVTCKLRGSAAKNQVNQVS